jgi:hypothetical protein
MVFFDDLNSLTTLLFNTVKWVRINFYFGKIFKGLHLITNKHKYLKSYFSFLSLFFT